MNLDLSIPPRSIADIKTPEELSIALKCLIGKTFILSGKPRTDGSKLRRIISEALIQSGIADPAEHYDVIPPKGKGVPRILRELIDTYLVTTGNNYNLQVWNRFPNSNSILVQYPNGDCIRCRDIRLVFVKVCQNAISSIIITTPQYIEHSFGLFGKPTIKHQLIISDKKRSDVIGKESHILTSKDSSILSYILSHNRICSNSPSNLLFKGEYFDKILSIAELNEVVSKKLIGMHLDSADTKTRGQNLERATLYLLGYNDDDIVSLEGNYPDIPEQLLEVKVQDSPTVDLGKHTPEIPEPIFDNLSITSQDIRYLIALTDSATGVIEGVILVPGKELGNYFTYVSDTSYKCQRSIPMSFFDSNTGQSLAIH